MNCIKCGGEFELLTTRGRPRKKCYICKPTRSKKAKPPIQRKAHTVEELKSNPHCPWCGAYPDSGETFCNPNHRAQFADKVKREQARQRIRHQPGMSGRHYAKRVPAEVANPIDPPTVNGSCVTRDVEAMA